MMTVGYRAGQSQPCSASLQCLVSWHFSTSDGTPPSLPQITPATRVRRGLRRVHLNYSCAVCCVDSPLPHFGSQCFSSYPCSQSLPSCALWLHVLRARKTGVRNGPEQEQALGSMSWLYLGFSVRLAYQMREIQKQPKEFKLEIRLMDYHFNTSSFLLHWI